MANLDGLTPAVALENIGRLIDASGDLGRPRGAETALSLCDELEPRLSGPDRAVLHYFRGNAWDCLRLLRPGPPLEESWSWVQPEMEHRVLHLRQAVQEPGFAELPTVRRCQILTNLASSLNTIGRFVEAVEHWGSALTLEPDFAMARGNRGHGLSYYARSLCDPGHAAVFLMMAHSDLTAALSDSALWESTGYESAKMGFERSRAEIERVVDVASVKRQLNLHNFSLGESEVEERYRRWCLAERLFLNPLNDLGAYPIAAQDVLGLPNYITRVNDPPTLIGFYNQVKQEFVSARYLYYEGITIDTHFSDRGVLLIDTLDYPVYSLAAEKVRLAFRAAYSIFDKIAFFLNTYLSLGIEPRRVGFRTLWYERDGERRPRSLRACFTKCENWPLRGLFWLAKDLAADEPSIRDTTAPDAADLQAIRNHLEHRYFRLHEMDADQPVGGLAWSATRGDFELKTLRLLRLVRAALIYLSLGMHQEERLRSQVPGRGAAMPVMLPSVTKRN